MLRPFAAGAHLLCSTQFWSQHPGFATLADACFGLLQQVGCSGLSLFGAGHVQKGST